MAGILHVLRAFENIYIHKDDEHIPIFQHCQTLEAPKVCLMERRRKFKDCTIASFSLCFSLCECMSVCACVCAVGYKETSCTQVAEI